MGFTVMRIRKTLALVVCMAFSLLAIGFAAPPVAAAGSPTIHLWMSRAGGWGTTNTSLQNPGLPGGENTVLIVAGVIVIIVAVVAFAAFFWRRMGKQGTPPPPPP